MNVKEKFDSYPPKIRSRMKHLRKLILDVAKHLPEVGKLEETLKWGEPAYLTSQTKSGTTIRIDWKEKNPAYYCLYVHCQTSLVDSYRSIFPDTFVYEGNRAVCFPVDEPLEEEALRICIEMALTYHLKNG